MVSEIDISPPFDEVRNWQIVRDELEFLPNSKVLAEGATKARTLKDRFADKINVQDFVGSDNTGATDSAAAVQAWLNALAANGGTGFWSGEFKINSPASITSNAKPFRIMGSGKAATKIVAGADIGTPISFINCSGITVEGFTLDCQFSSFTTNANHGIAAQDCDDILFRDIHVEDYKNTAIICFATVANTFSRNIIDGCTSDGLGVANNGLLVEDLNDSGIRNSTATAAPGSPGHALQLKNDCRRCFIEDSSGRNSVNGLTLASDGTNGPSQCRASNVYAGGNTVGFVASYMDNCKISGLLIDMESAGESAIDLNTNCIRNDVEVSVLNVAATKNAVLIRFGSTDNFVRLSHFDNNNVTGNAFGIQAGATDNTVIVERHANLTFTDPYDLVDDSEGGSTNIFQLGTQPMYQVLSIASGAITIASAKIQAVVMNTEGAAATDDLDTITGPGVEGQVISLRQRVDAQDVTIKHNTGNILLDGSVDLVFTAAADTLLLIYNAIISKWCEIGRGNNA